MSVQESEAYLYYTGESVNGKTEKLKYFSCSKMTQEWRNGTLMHRQILAPRRHRNGKTKKRKSMETGFLKLF